MTNLFEEADAHGIQVEYCRLPTNASMAVQDREGDFVLIDYSLMHRSGEEQVHLAHEIGHCVTGAFYSFYALPFVRAKAEASANRWAIKKLLPMEELYEAFRDGCHEAWELAEYFDLPQDFTENALGYYGLL
jgi:Zn-dependent peptidase ImmA (M78 family)